MKRKITILTSLCLLLMCISSLSFVYAYGGTLILEGTGAVDDPFLIRNGDEFDYISDKYTYKTHYFRIENDITLTTAQWFDGVFQVTDCLEYYSIEDTINNNL